MFHECGSVNYPSTKAVWHGDSEHVSQGNCADNGAGESFFAHFKAIAGFDSKATFESNSKKALAAVDFYNTQRVQTRLGGLPPTLFRMMHDGVSHSLQ